ncbi:MAG TPA: hypothetical protein VGQ62_08985, partial [Chloroflexota bacterium]|nr:hypothetical protein [Chloroflexota bacterium]
MRRRIVERGGQWACLAVALLSSPFAVYDLIRWARLIETQFAGPAPGGDFLNLYTGAWLVLHLPAET